MISRETERIFRDWVSENYGDRCHCLICNKIFDVNDKNTRFIAFIENGDIEAELACPDCSKTSLANYP